MDIIFKRRPEGGYVTPDGRFTVTRWINRTSAKPGGAGRKEWTVTDTTGKESFKIMRFFKSECTATTITEARAIIARVIRNETEGTA